MIFDFANQQLEDPAKKNALLAFGLNMMANSRGQGLGQAIGNSGMAGMNAYADYQQQDLKKRKEEQAMSEAAQNNNITRQLHEAQMAEFQAKTAAMKRKQEYLSTLNPVSQGLKQGAAMGDIGPTNSNLERVNQASQINPYEAMAAGLDVKDIQALAESGNWGKSKIKDYKEIKNQDGSVSVVGFDDYGNPVDTKQTPFKEPKIQSFGGFVGGIDPITGSVSNYGLMTNSPDSLLSAETQRRGQNMTDSRSREANNINRQAQRTAIVETPNGLVFADKGARTAEPVMMGGKQVQQKNSPLYEAEKQAGQMQEAITMARTLIPKATSSGAGALRDTAYGFVGKSSAAADAASQLETIGGWLTSTVPRMEGPQSDKDTMQYRQMAAAVGDKTKPASQRLAALESLEQLMQRQAQIRAEMTGAEPPKQNRRATDNKFNGFKIVR